MLWTGQNVCGLSDKWREQTIDWTTVCPLSVCFPSLFPHPSLPPCTLLSLVPSVLAFSRLPLWGGTGWPAALEPHLTSFLRFQSTYQSLEKDASIPVLGHMPTPRLMTLFITLRYSDQSGLCVHSWDREDGGTWLITCRLVQRLFLIGRELSARIRIKGC